MICCLTHVAKPLPMIRGGYQQAVNVTDGECAATLTTRICGVKGIYPTITLSNNTGGVLEYA